MVAKKALESCRAPGFQSSVAVVDGGGNLQVVLRDKLAGVSSPDGAILKAKTSINFRSATTSLSEVVNSNIEVSGIK
ncbi:MAG: heme-binding protein [Candidatus Thiodiazotropha endolucinida]